MEEKEKNRDERQAKAVVERVSMLVRISCFCGAVSAAELAPGQLATCPVCLDSYGLPDGAWRAEPGTEYGFYDPRSPSRTDVSVLPGTFMA